jgi:hypothetical protein
MDNAGTIILPWQGGEMTQALYAHMNNQTIKKKEKINK